MTVLYLSTVPRDDCGEPIDYLRRPWYPLYPDDALCHGCGQGRGLTGIMLAADEAR